MKTHTVKILFSGISSKIGQEIKLHIAESSFTAEFCNFSDAENEILKFSPDILITAISSFPDFENQVTELKSISELHNIPFAVIVNREEEDSYLFLASTGITKILTLPVTRQDFLRYLSRFLSPDYCENPDNEIISLNKYSCSEGEEFLISNLVIQNRMLKDHLKKNKSSDNSKKIHYEKVNENRIIEARLWEAYDNNYFRLYYQPVMSLETGKLAGFEALIRLIHPEDGIIPPDEFISVAENSAIIFPLGLWIVEEACRQIVQWKETFILDTPLRINVNISAKQFIHPDLITNIFEITEKLGIDEKDIAFELTESAFMEDMESANIALLELKSRKFAIYMDDFGTGYSSLSYLMHFPVNVIKIDQSFVKWMHIDEQSETLVRSIVALAHNLGLKVVAEGTDDASQIDILKECGCDYAQGYYFAKPLPAEDAARFISDYFKEK